MKNLKGVIPALLTPFDSDNKINKQALKQLIERNISQGACGFYVAGSTAEAFLLTESERLELYEIVKEIVGDRVSLIAHVGDVSTDKAIMYAKKAQELGYDVISAVAPFYYKFSIPQIKKYYYDIVTACSLPMLVYNIPAFSGVSFSTADFEEFLRDDRFIGVKFTSSDMFQLERLKSKFPDKLVYNGYDEMFLSGLSMGADGGIGSTYNFMTDKFVKIKELFDKGDINAARDVQKQANEIISVFGKYGCMETEKLIMNLLGLDFGTARPPFSLPTEDMTQYIKENIMPLI